MWDYARNVHWFFYFFYVNLTSCLQDNYGSTLLCFLLSKDYGRWSLKFCYQVEAQLNQIRKETQEYTSRCAAEAREMVEAVDAEVRNLANVEKEAAEFLKVFFISCLASTLCLLHYM